MHAILVFFGLAKAKPVVSRYRVQHAAMSSQEREMLRLWTSNASQYR